MKWITRERIQVNRTATCWLIRRFLDKEAEFIFVPADQVASIQAQTSATGLDAPGTTYPHKDAQGLCSFAALVHERLAHDPVLLEMARIVQAADIKDELDDHPAACGLQLISRGFPLVTSDDQETAKRAEFVYDALYASIKVRPSPLSNDEERDTWTRRKADVKMKVDRNISYRALIHLSLARKARRVVLIVVAFVVATSFVLVACSAPQNQAGQANSQQPAATDWKAVEQALGKAGSVQPGDVYKVSLPRTDLQVTVGDVQVKAPLALGSWVAFKKAASMTMVMGDLVLTEDEVTPVLTKLQEGGVEQTALHNHVLHESPRIMYMHISAMGDAVKIAKAIHDALALSKTPFTAPAATTPNQDVGIDTKQLDQILGQSGKVNGGVYQFSVARAEKILDNEMEIPPSMGVAHAINFQPTGGGKAAITGDFVLIASEVNPVIRALRDNGIQVTAVHSHMLVESPRLFFMHFWANDDALKLARGIRAALDKTSVAKA